MLGTLSERDAAIERNLRSEEGPNILRDDPANDDDDALDFYVGYGIPFHAIIVLRLSVLDPI